jgi:hypothetical protein
MRASTLSIICAFLVGASSAAAILPRAQYPDPPKAIRPKSTMLDIRFQPALDFDKDGCYNVPAISADGVLSQGLAPGNSLTAGCRDPSDLDNNNVYVRQRCNRHWCAYLYSYYFEKDVTWPLTWAHRHDWEHVIVWAKDAQAKYVSVSAHGGYHTEPANKVRFLGSNRPKVVYHRGGLRTHSFRLAEAKDEKIENATGDWFFGALISWNGFPSFAVREKLQNANFGSAHWELRDETAFTKALIETMPPPARADGFDCAYDDGSPGWP